jgi:Rrf2 family iron-sulfur cluster assembly transcriptional regulator
MVAHNKMLCLSQTTGYAMHALSCLSPGKALLIRQVADRTGIQKPYLAKIINQLTNKNLVTTKRGYRGGICLARPPQDIAVLEIVEAIEGPDWIGHCLLGMRECNSHQICPTHDLWLRMKEQIRRKLSKTTLADVADIPNWRLGKPRKPRGRVPKPPPGKPANAPGQPRSARPQRNKVRP